MVCVCTIAFSFPPLHLPLLSLSSSSHSHLCTYSPPPPPTLKSGASKFPRETFSEDVQNIRKGDPPTQGPLTVMLTSEEELYGKLRDFNFRKVGKYLSSEAKRIKEIYDVSWQGWVTFGMQVCEVFSNRSARRQRPCQI